MMTTGPLCLTCGYWVADAGLQCEMCRSAPSPGVDPQTGELTAASATTEEPKP